MDGSSIPHHCSVSQLYTSSTVCPSSEWQTIQNYLVLAERAVPWSLEKELNLLIPPNAVYMTGFNSLRQFQFQTWLAPNPLDTNEFLTVQPVISTTQQSVIADALVTTGALWSQAINYAHAAKGHGSPFFDQQVAVHTISTGYYQPYTLATCVNDTIRGRNDQRPVAFPINPFYDYALQPNSLQYVNGSVAGIPAIEYPSLVRAELLDLPGSPLNGRVKWIELPQDLFNSTSIGFIIVLPQDFTDTTEGRSGYDYVICNVDAGWGSSSIKTSSNENIISATSSLVSLRSYNVAAAYKSQQAKNRTQGMNYYEAVTDLSLQFGRPDYPSIQIEIGQEWAKYLNPVVHALNTTVMDILLKISVGMSSEPKYYAISAQFILSGLVTNGLARLGFDGMFQGTPKTKPGPNGTVYLDGHAWLSDKNDFFTVDTNQSKDWVKLQVDSTIEGYAYNTYGVSPKVAIAFLLMYCVLALTHVLYAGISGELHYQPYLCRRH